MEMSSSVFAGPHLHFLLAQRGPEAVLPTDEVLQRASSVPRFKGKCQAVTFLARGDMLGKVLGVQLWAVFTGLCHGVTVTQKERFKTIQAGAQADITCEHDDRTYFTIYWFRQEHNSGQKELQLIGFSIEGNTPSLEKENYRIDRSDVTRASLRIPPEEAAKPAVYFCAVSKAQRELQVSHLHRNFPALCIASICATKPNHFIYTGSESQQHGALKTLLEHCNI
ncbi:uncharacterized protein LOC112541454 [Python bivittatus]|uniref:Uncharacterized protein LOC112541454 n=1 Tax=Python bivittatus TaxID=176946 RepID=A0A9F5J7T1_PYTBI|nr:uncharacterized protein LOC112541454 [Python bivittatus]